MRANIPTLSLSAGCTGSLVKKARITASALILATGLALPQISQADFGVGTGAGATAAADLDFQVIIPTFIAFSVGTPTAGTVSFDLTLVPGNVGDGDNTVGGAPVVAVAVKGNGGTVTITETNSTTNGLENGTEAINFSEVTSTGGGTIVAPVLSNSASNTSTVTAAANGVVNATDSWTFNYENNTVPAPGTYTSTVTYTASIP